MWHKFRKKETITWQKQKDIGKKKTSSDVLHKCQSMAKSQDSLAHLKNSHPLCKSPHSKVCVPLMLEHLSLANSYRSLRSRFLDQNTVFIVDVRLMIKTPCIASYVAAQFVHPAGMRSAPTPKKKAVQACPTLSSCQHCPVPPSHAKKIMLSCPQNNSRTSGGSFGAIFV